MNLGVCFIAFLWPLIASAYEASGGTVQNGGDAMVCGDTYWIVARSPEAKTRFYSMDYVYEVEDGVDPKSLVKVKNWSESWRRIAVIIGRLSPRLEVDFREFTESTSYIGSEENIPKKAAKRWRSLASRNGFSAPAAPFKKVPRGCVLVPPNGQPSWLEWYQIITRVYDPSKKTIEYQYDPSAIQKMATPMQFSFLMVHEWLWTLTEDPKVSRKVNSFLHGKEIDQMGGAEISRKLEELGLRTNFY